MSLLLVFDSAKKLTPLKICKGSGAVHYDAHINRKKEYYINQVYKPMPYRNWTHYIIFVNWNRNNSELNLESFGIVFLSQDSPVLHWIVLEKQYHLQFLASSEKKSNYYRSNTDENQSDPYFCQGLL